MSGYKVEEGKHTQTRTEQQEGNEYCFFPSLIQPNFSPSDTTTLSKKVFYITVFVLVIYLYTLFCAVFIAIRKKSNNNNSQGIEKKTNNIQGWDVCHVVYGSIKVPLEYNRL